MRLVGFLERHVLTQRSGARFQNRFNSAGRHKRHLRGGSFHKVRLLPRARAQVRVPDSNERSRAIAESWDRRWSGGSGLSLRFDDLNSVGDRLPLGRIAHGKDGLYGLPLSLPSTEGKLAESIIEDILQR
jgi:hypothetical protein